MTKHQYLLLGPRGEAGESFAERMRWELAPRLLDASGLAIKLSLTEPDLPRPFFLPVNDRNVGLLSVWDADPSERSRLEELLLCSGARVAGYQVEESSPLSYERTWPDGEASPGACLLTMFRKRTGLSQERFVQIWHEEHSPAALRIHPMWAYVRNVVLDEILPASPRFDGIVEEQYRDAAQLSDPRVFFGGSLWLLPNLLYTLWHTNGFLELWTLENWIVREHHLRSRTDG